MDGSALLIADAALLVVAAAVVIVFYLRDLRADSRRSKADQGPDDE